MHQLLYRYIEYNALFELLQQYIDQFHQDTEFIKS